MGLFVGVDPGSQGALCLLAPLSRTITFSDIPPKLPTREFFIWLHRQVPFPETVWVEEVHSLPGMNAGSNFNFGRNVGIITTCLELFDREIKLIQPKQWQKLVGIHYPKKCPSAERKKITADKCMELYPEAPIWGPRGGLKDGRADALMIAHAASLIALTGG